MTDTTPNPSDTPPPPPAAPAAAPPAAKEKKPNKFFGWARQNRRWALLLLPVVFLIGVAFGSTGAGNTSQIESLEADLAALQEELDEANGMFAAAEAAAIRAEDERDAAEAALAEREAGIAEREAALGEREAAADEADAAVAARSFGAGTWLVGTDIEPGTYRANADSCYWERLSGLSGGFDDIIANDFSSGSHVVTIASSDAAFSSSGCGTWERVD